MYDGQKVMGGLIGPGNSPVDVAYTRPTITENLTQRKQKLEEELNNVNNALDALKANPGIEEVMNLVVKASY